MKKLISIVLISAAIAAGAYVFALVTADKDDFKPAEDFPRDALIYIQISDLPALVKLWSESDLRRKYLESENFADFSNNHLALKLAERANEINFGVGIYPDLEFAATLSENHAALAIYDIGKMEFVFIAPVSAEKTAAAKLFQNQAGFEEIRLEDETIVWRSEIRVDRERQAQSVFFTNFRGRLILATSEKYFLQTLDNVRGKTPSNRLTGEPLFRQLAVKTKPHLASVWLHQQKLNEDWYFKHYWLMSAPGSLGGLRAGMIDFEVRDEKIIEKRVFLTSEKYASVKITPAAAKRVARFIPAGAPLAKLEAVGSADSDEPISDFLFDAENASPEAESKRWREKFYFRDWEKSYSYSYLDDDFREQIDESEDEISAPSPPDKKTSGELTNIIDAAAPQISLKIFSPQTLPAPLFFENRKALVFSLQSPQNLNAPKLENALAESARSLSMVRGETGEIVWTDLQADGFAARQMTLPALGGAIFYARRGNELVFANSAELLKEVLADRNETANFLESFENLTVIRFDQGRETFDAVFRTLEMDEPHYNGGKAGAKRFFTGNIGSLLDLAANIERVEIRRDAQTVFLFEETTVFLKRAAD